MKKSLAFLSLLTSTALFSMDCDERPSSRFELRHRDPKGVGYNEGYTTGEFFLPIPPISWCTTFIDLRAHVFNDGRWAANGGLGARKSFGPFLTGLNVYYDYRDIERLGGQSRLGAGGELLSKWADLRLNGYAPVGDSKFAGPRSFSHFCGHSAFGKQKIAATLPSIDLEIGAPIPGPFEEIDLYAALGTYYLFEREVEGFNLGGAWGGRARVDLRIYDGIRIGADVTYDHIFNTRAQGYIGLSLPLGPANMQTRGKRFKEKYGHCHERALEQSRELQSVYRQEIIPSESACVHFRLVPKGRCREGFLPPGFIPPSFTPPGFVPTGKIVFVDNRASSGNGTFESPYRTLIDAENHSIPGDIIYVFYGDGTSKGMSEGIVLQENQAWIGSGISFELGGVIIPPFDPNKKPTITNNARTNGSGAFFGAEVSPRDVVVGLLFDGGPSGGNLIACDATNSNSFIFSSNEVIDTNDPVVKKMGSIADAQIIIFNNIFNEIPTPISFAGSLTSSAIAVIGNTFIAPTGSGPAIDLFGLSPGTATNSLIQVSGNSFQASGVVDISTTFTSLTNSALVINENDSTKLGTNISAFIVNVTGGRLNFSNNITANVGTASLLESVQTSMTNGAMCATGNNFANGWGLTLSSNGGSIACLHLVGNTQERDLTITASAPTEIESPDGPDDLSFAGLQDLNPDAVIVIHFSPGGHPIPVDEGTCGCSEAPIR